MLYKLNVPSCRTHLDWIVQLQRRLLAALCQPDITANRVTVEWVVEQLADLDRQWVERFCVRRDGITNLKRTMLEHMQTIAAFPDSRKQELLRAFDNDQLFNLAFDNVNPRPNTLIGISFLDDEQAKHAVRGFFESFYKPNFYASAGYLIPQTDGTMNHFDKDAFLEQFKRENDNVVVCPLCDGSLDGAEIDHFYPKSKFPSLSCHPLNLVPTCPICNSRTNKGEKIPLTLTAQDPTVDWFHPYLRPAAGTFQVRFEPVRGGMVPVLFSEDAQTQKRLDNLNHLINLKARWREHVSRRVQSTQGWIRRHRERVGRQVTDEELIIKLREWADNAESDYGRQPHSILATHYLRSAAAREPTTYEELRVYVTSLGPMTAAAVI